MIYFVLILATTCVPVNSSIYDEVKNHENWNMLPVRNCGKPNPGSRIVGGDVASLGQFPWISRLAYKFSLKKGIEFKCAGSLINEAYVLTAAHCLTTRLRKKLQFVRLGENYGNVKIDCQHDICAPIPQDIGVEKVIIHEKFNIRTFKNDIALVSLANKAKFNAFVLPICLPRGKFLDKNFTLTGHVQVAGWGETNSLHSYYPSRLRYVSLPVQSIEKCNRISLTTLDSSQYCIGEGKGKDSCNGDSGGPMMKAVGENSRSRYFLFGIVSYGPSICGEDPAIYISVPHYMKWILDHLNHHQPFNFKNTLSTVYKNIFG